MESQAKREAALRLLISHGADPSIPDAKGRTPAQATSAQTPLGALAALLDIRPQDVAGEAPAAAKAKARIEKRGGQGRSLSERAQMRGIAEAASEPAPKPPRKGL